MKPLAVAKVKRRSNRFSTSPCINASASFILSRSLAAPANKLDHFSFVKIPSRQKLRKAARKRDKACLVSPSHLLQRPVCLLNPSEPINPTSVLHCTHVGIGVICPCQCCFGVARY